MFHDLVVIMSQRKSKTSDKIQSNISNIKIKQKYLRHTLLKLWKCNRLQTLDAPDYPKSMRLFPLCYEPSTNLSSLNIESYKMHAKIHQSMQQTLNHYSVLLLRTICVSIQALYHRNGINLYDYAFVEDKNILIFRLLQKLCALSVQVVYNPFICVFNDLNMDIMDIYLNFIFNALTNINIHFYDKYCIAYEMSNSMRHLSYLAIRLLGIGDEFLEFYNSFVESQEHDNRYFCGLITLYRLLWRRYSCASRSCPKRTMKQISDWIDTFTKEWTFNFETPNAMFYYENYPLTNADYVIPLKILLVQENMVNWIKYNPISTMRKDKYGWRSILKSANNKVHTTILSKKYLTNYDENINYLVLVDVTSLKH